jgi:YCII-related domain
VHTARTVRVRDGRPFVTDGPFAETKEQLLGIYLIDAGDLNDAIQVASRIPSARLGSIEVRPVWDLRRGEPRRRADEQDIHRVATTRSRALAHDHVTSGRDRESGAMERAERMRGDRAGN